MSELDRADQERIVQIITEEVVKYLDRHSSFAPTQSKLTPVTLENLRENADSVASQDSKDFTSTRLVTAKDAVMCVKEKYRKVALGNATILTPLALDLLRDHGVMIVRQDGLNPSAKDRAVSSSQDVVVLAPGASQTHIRIVAQAIAEADLALTKVVTHIPSFRMATEIKKVAQSISAGEFGYGIVLGEGLYPSFVQTNRLEGIRATMGSDAQSIETGRMQQQNNLLFLHIRMMGFPKLHQIVHGWLTRRNSHNQ